MTERPRLWTGACGALGLLLVALPAGAAPKKKAPAHKPAARKTAAKAAPALPAALKEATSLDIAPASITLDGPRALQHLVVTATLKDGSGLDVTDLVTVTVADPKLAKFSDGRLLPLADGSTRVTATVGKLHSAPSDLAVKNSKAPAELEFVNDIMPVLSKAGCNSTACHGSPVGKGGFKLSLFGYEPELDHNAIVKDPEGGAGKRVDLKAPEKSLLLTKATMTAPHGGGVRFKVGSSEYKTVLAWLKGGAPGIGEFEARVKSVEVIPDEAWVPAPHTKQRLVVTAHMSDGSGQDVTDKVLFSSNDDAIAEVDGDGNVTAKRAGETAVMVRYLGQVAISRVAVLPTWKLDRYPRIEKRSYIDELVQAKLQKLRMVPSDLCTDEEFIRRATLDTCGIIPTPEEVMAFVKDVSGDKRAKLVDKLLTRPEFVDLWTLKWNDTLRNNPQVVRRGTLDYYGWIREEIATNRPYDQFVKELVTASGRSVDGELTEDALPPNLQGRPNIGRILETLNQTAPNPACNYYVVSKDPLDVTSATSQVFMGVRIECARCHNHPFEKWTQNDYYGLAAFFSGLQVRGQAQLASIVSINPRGGTIRNPKTNEIVEPKTLDNSDVKMDTTKDHRKALADWIASPSNPWFAKALVNRVWGHYFGRGIVEPIDDFRVTNPASNPELLDGLAKDFVDHKFDVKAIHRAILNSRTYQESSKPNQYNREDTSNFARYYPKRLMAEQLYDSISQATGIFLTGGGNARGGRRRLGMAPALGNLGNLAKGNKKYGSLMPDGPVERVTQVPAFPPNRRGNGLSQFLDTFGKPRREVVCECERSSDGNMGQALVLINGNEVNMKISSPYGRVQKELASPKQDPEVISDLYLAALSRQPTPEEMSEAGNLIRSSASRKEGIEDLMWSLLNSREFLFNH